SVRLLPGLLGQARHGPQSSRRALRGAISQNWPMRAAAWMQAERTLRRSRPHMGRQAGPMPRGTALAGAWADALALLREDMLRRDAAARTRGAYETDLAQFARWAGGQGLAPGEVGPKAVRRYIASLSEQGAAASTTGRKLAALRALF